MIFKKSDATVLAPDADRAVSSSTLWNPASRAEPIGLTSATLAVAIAAVWGGNVVALKIGLDTFPPFWTGLWRMSTGAMVVGFWARLRGISLKPQPGELRFLLALGLLFTVQIAGLNLGVDLTSPAFGVVLINSHPLFANFIGHFVVKEDRLSWPRLCGLTLAFGGICLVFLGEPSAELASRPILGNLIVTSSGLLLGLRTVYTQRLVQSIPPERPVFWQMLISLPCFLLAGLLWEQPVLKPIDAEAVWAILYQGVAVAGLCFIVWTALLTRHSPGSLSFFAFPTPIFGVLASAWVYGEALTARLWLGLAAVTVGIWIATRRQTPAATSPEFRGVTQ